MCTWYLQGLGASVIKVEQPGVGDTVRYVPPLGPDGTGVWFHALNAGKRSVALDLRSAEGREKLARLLDGADVLVEGFRPGVMARLGLDPQALRELYPRLIIVSISGYGQTGEHAGRPGHDVGYQGLAGALSLAARHDGVPDPTGVQIADTAGGALTAALSVAAALYARAQTGEGRWVDVSMTHGVMALVGPMLAAAAAGTTEPPGEGMLTGGLSNYQLYRCADGGVISFGALEPKFQAAFTALTGVALPADRATLAELCATRDGDDWAAELGQACVEPVLELAEVMNHPLHRGRGAVVGEGAAARITPPFSDGVSIGDLPAPGLGEHDDLLDRADPWAAVPKPDDPRTSA